MAAITAYAALTTCDSLLSDIKRKLGDAQGIASSGGLGQTVVHLAGLSQAVTDVQADVRARLALKGGRS